MASHVETGSGTFYVYIVIIALLVLMSGLMSGLTLGLMSLGQMELEVLKRSGTPREKKNAARIIPVVRNQHLLLVTLLICNAACMETLPIFLDKLVSPVLAIVISVTLILMFGEIIPQAICSRYGLAVGASISWFVWGLMGICFIIAWPISKLLDYLLGHDKTGLMRRHQLKALVSMHNQEAGQGGELTTDETTIISGALELAGKTAGEAMTPIESTYSLDLNSHIDWDTMYKIQATGHSRIPVYSGSQTNIIGILLTKNLLTVRPEENIPLYKLPIRRIPHVSEHMPLFDLLNEFQKGHSHMAMVVRHKDNTVPRMALKGTPKTHSRSNSLSQMTGAAQTADFNLSAPKLDQDSPVATKDGKPPAPFAKNLSIKIPGSDSSPSVKAKTPELSRKSSYKSIHVLDVSHLVPGSKPTEGHQESLQPVPEDKKALQQSKSNIGMTAIFGPLLGPGISGLSEAEMAELPPQTPGTESAILNTPETINRVKSSGSVQSEASSHQGSAPQNGLGINEPANDSARSRHVKRWNHNTQKIEDLDGELALWAARNEEVVGIITLEDVIEELLQEEIIDETDEFVDVANRIRVTRMKHGAGPPIKKPLSSLTPSEAAATDSPMQSQHSSLAQGEQSSNPHVVVNVE